MVVGLNSTGGCETVRGAPDSGGRLDSIEICRTGQMNPVTTHLKYKIGKQKKPKTRLGLQCQTPLSFKPLTLNPNPLIPEV